jgi:hypothetical protein
VDDLGKKLREVLGDFPILPFASRRPATAEESKESETEGVVINPVG